MQQTCCLTVLPSDGASRVKQTHTILHRLKNVSLTSADLATDTQLILQFFNLFHFRAFFFLKYSLTICTKYVWESTIDFLLMRCLL